MAHDPAVSGRRLHAELRRRFGAAGKTRRVFAIWRSLREDAANIHPVRVSADDLAVARERIRALETELAAATERAVRAEEMERHHQDYWANRYAEKLAELELQRAQALKPTGGVSHAEYLRVHRLAAELSKRLAQYEDPQAPSVRTQGVDARNEDTKREL